MRGVDAAKRLVAELEKRTLIVNRLITASGGQLTVTEPLDGEIEVNVGGTVLCVPRKPLLLPGVSDSFIAYLLLHHLDGLPKDTEGRPFLDADPIYIDWLFNEIANVGAADAQAETHEIKLTGDHSTDVSFLFWHELLFNNKTQLNTNGQDGQQTATPDPHDTNTLLAALSHSSANLTKAFKQVMDEHQQLLKFHRVMGPFLKSADGQGDEIKSVRVMGRTVSTTEATLAFIGTDKRLYTTFDNIEAISCISPAHFMKVVDFARRQRVASVGGIVKPPTAPNQRQLTTDCGMYGLTMADFHKPLLWADELQWIIDNIGKGNVTTTLLFKSSRDTFAYASFLNKVAYKSGLLFAIRDGDTHRFGAFIDGELTPPDDPRQTSGRYKVPLFLYSLSGAFDALTKIEIPGEGQVVDVAVTQGVVPNLEGWPAGRVRIGRYSGVLWLGTSQPGPVPDLSSCQQWIKEGELPDGYNGEINTRGNGTLAQSHNFTCDEMEVYHVEVNGA
ncbi:unnamed protein product [Vitrella brassicaformis CCMP3155]|uniref:TLDc domain-containing protein n=1 Tax=Vitrella brassicaformis (strain CCMP3155) TaxID=1169540 RepID=A0A0G4FRC2_VITBC|nr:unnamed protein product [Vitrella brassicaformis CCMP3155]|eukprot:CEM16782.1 unnamed protein product [Vitrella brassicaformis CCMP3155]